MKKTVLFLGACISLIADVDISGHLDLDSQFFPISPEGKNPNSFTAQQTLLIAYNKDSLSAFANLYAQVAYHDFVADNKNTNRTFARVDELFLKYDFDDAALKAGKSIEFWGALELQNIVDGFNPRDFRNDLFSNDKLGVYNIAYSHYFENSELSLIAKLQEEKQIMASQAYVYNFFPSFVSYDGTLNAQEGIHRPSIYLKFSGSTDTEYAIDYAFIYENGYDSQRYFSTTTPQNLDPTSPTFGHPTRFELNTYIANKIMTYNTLVVGSTLIKLEALFAKVDEDNFVGDYSHIALGIEHTIENIYESHSLGLICEYYRYDTYESDKYTDLELFQTLQNDTFVGMRYTLNNSNDSSLVGGGIFDFEYGEQMYYMKFDSRVMDSMKVALDYYYVEPSTTTTTPYSLLGRHQKLGLNIAYYF